MSTTMEIESYHKAKFVASWGTACYKNDSLLCIVNWHCSMWSRPFILFILIPIFRDMLPNSKCIVLVTKCFIEIDLNFLK